MDCAANLVEVKNKFPAETKAWMTSPSDSKMLLIKHGLVDKYDLELNNILVYDFESTDKNVCKKGEKLDFVGQQVPMSFSVCSKIGEIRMITETVLIDECEYFPYELVKKFVDVIVKKSIVI